MNSNDRVEGREGGKKRESERGRKGGRCVCVCACVCVCVCVHVCACVCVGVILTVK